MPDTLTNVSLDIRPLTPVIGAEVHGIDLRQPLTDTTISELQQAINRWKVLFFRDQDITDEQFLRFGRYFGPLTPAHPIAEGLPEHPEIWERKADEYRERRQENAVNTARPPRDNNGWHIDITFVANPNKYSILRGTQIPAYGGDTLWSNLVAAYEGLSPKIKALIDDLQAVHGTGGYDNAGAKGEKKGPFVSLHPLVRVHPDTGEKVLFLNIGVTSHIVGLNGNENKHILELLASEITRPVAATDTDAIVIGTWPDLHCPVTLVALAAGKHVLCEARMARDLAEARQMLAAADAHPEQIAQLVPAPMTLEVDRTVTRLLGAGFLGELLAVDVQANSATFPDPNAPLHWRQNRARSGNNILTMGIWYETILRWVGEATSVYAQGKISVGKRNRSRNQRTGHYLYPRPPQPPLRDARKRTDPFSIQRGYWIRPITLCHPVRHGRRLAIPAGGWRIIWR